MPYFFQEDGLEVNDYYWQKLPTKEVSGEIRFKTPQMVIAGLPYFFAVFSYLEQKEIGPKAELLLEWEGKYLGGESIDGNYGIDRIYNTTSTTTTNLSTQATTKLSFKLPFRAALTGERLALNLLSRASSIATQTAKFVEMASPYDIAILETRKTTPGLRFLEKYAVRVGGGHNHRFTQTDAFMIKDNHKTFFGGLKAAYSFFKQMQSFYTPIIVEIHSLTELKEAISMGIDHVMLDNFSPEQIKEALTIKKHGMTIELSGGINQNNLSSYLLKGVDAISVGALTYEVPAVDISFKYSQS